MRALITIFNGRERGLGEGEKPSVYVQQSVEFRNYLKYFKGSSLIVFECIYLHANAEGWAWPSLPTICRLTGRNRHTVQKAITFLCKLDIPGYGRVMLKVQPHFSGRYQDTHYLIFPKPNELQEYEKDGELPPRLQKRRKTKKLQEPTFSPTEKQAPKKQAPKKQEPKNHAVMHELETILTRTMHEPSTHTQPEGARLRTDSVSVNKPGDSDLSIHTLDDLLAFCEEQQAGGAKIVPLAVAMARKRDGKIDSVVSKWKRERLRPDVKNCPDCKGSGFNLRIYEMEHGRTVRCDHRALFEAATNETAVADVA